MSSDALTPSQIEDIKQYNSLAMQTTYGCMDRFWAEWFSNMRSLIRARFNVHGVAELANRLGARYDTFLVLGSGPSALAILKALRDPSSVAVLCSPTALGACKLAGIRPAAVVSLDANPIQYLHVAECDVSSPETLDVVLPCYAHPSWYDAKSVLDPEHMFFYKPYLNDRGSYDNLFNVALKELCPEIRQMISQGGSVTHTAFNVADWACGTSPDKHVYLAADFSWPKGGPYRAPSCKPTEELSEIVRSAWGLPQEVTDGEVIDLPGGCQTDLVSLQYAIGVLHEMNEFINSDDFRHERYALVREASGLYLDMPVDFPCVTANEIGSSTRRWGEVHWPWKLMMGLISLSNSLEDRIVKTRTAKNIDLLGLKGKSAPEIVKALCDKYPEAIPARITKAVEEILKEEIYAEDKTSLGT